MTDEKKPPQPVGMAPVAMIEERFTRMDALVAGSGQLLVEYNQETAEMRQEVARTMQELHRVVGGFPPELAPAAAAIELLANALLRTLSTQR